MLTAVSPFLSHKVYLVQRELPEEYMWEGLGETIVEIENSYLYLVSTVVTILIQDI